MSKQTFTLVALSAILTAGLLLSAQVQAQATPPLQSRDWSAILQDDQVGTLLDGMTVLDDLRVIEAQGLRKAKLEVTPWSDSYWPTMYGGAAWRYNDRANPKSSDFQVNYDYFMRSPAERMDIDQLSPAEKYDRLLGDSTYTLTRANWKSGLDRLKTFGKVLSWEGYCHGWAVAAFSQSEPKRAVHVVSAAGEELTFYPSDIKALTTLLYANGDMPVEFIGTKCNDNLPREDEIGRNVQDECLTTNPGTWHVGVVSRVGLAKQSFVLDVTYDQAIWNQPISEYSYTYFNPRTLEVSSQLADAATPVAQFPRDKFKSHRAPGTAFIVGINMDLTYSRENYPAIGDHTAAPTTATVRYVYDLELDANGKILGGEWYSKIHPDFVWAPSRGAHPRSTGERDLRLETVWNPRENLPAELLEAARRSSRHNQPVFGIVKGLVEASK